MSNKQLKDQIERISEPTGEVQVEEFIRPLLEEMVQKITAPVLDLSTSDAAEKSLEVIKETTDLLERYQKNVDKIRPLIAQRKYELELNKEILD